MKNISEQTVIKLFIHTDNVIQGNVKEICVKYVEENGFVGLVFWFFP